ncbi:MAG: hypothetical protein RBS21_00810 [Corynebacterium sp.]|nr:hypothetical protein [Corynebacterium sp.]
MRPGVDGGGGVPGRAGGVAQGFSAEELEAFIDAAYEGLDVDLIGWAVLGVAIAAVVVPLLAWTVWRAATVFALLWALGVLVSFVVVNEHVREVIEEDRKLPVRLKLNLRYVAASVQAAQASFFGVLVFAGFLFLGLVSIPEATITAWTSKPPAIVELGPVNIPGALVKVSWVLGAFASLYMVTATAADKVAREEQLGPITAEVRGALNAAGALEKPTRSK